MLLEEDFGEVVLKGRCQAGDQVQRCSQVISETAALFQILVGRFTFCCLPFEVDFEPK